MSTERDELAAMRGELAELTADAAERDDDDWMTEAADAVLAAGYRKPRTIPDEHLRQSRDGSYPVKHNQEMIIQAADGSVWRFDLGDWDLLGWQSAALRGPAVVLYEGSQS